MTTDEELTGRVVDGVPVVRIDGEVDISNWMRVAAAIGGAAEGDGPGLVMDLRTTRYLDSSGVRVLFDARRQLAAQGRRLVLVTIARTPAESVLRHTGLFDVVPAFATIEEAIGILVGTARGGRGA